MGADTRADRPLERGELRAWYAYDWANSAYYQAAIVVFIPLLVNGMADDFAWSRADATRPPACDSDAWTAAMYDFGATCTQCVAGKGDRLFPGDLDVPKQSLPGGIDPLSLTFLVLSLSVLAQALTFVSFGPLGDVGAARRRGLVACSCVGSVATMLFMVLPASGADGGLYWLGAVLTVVSNVALGTSIVFYNSYLPLLVEASPDVRAKREEGSDKVQGARAARESEYSQKGMGWGYAGGTACLLIDVALALGLSNWLRARTLLALCIFVPGLWWFGFSLWSFRYFTDRIVPSEVVPTLRTVVGYGWRSTADTLRDARQHTQVFLFLVLWFFFSDGFGTIATVAAIFARTEMCFSLLETTVLAVVVPACAMAFCFVFLWIQKMTKWSAKGFLIGHLLAMGAIPAWGCVGFFTEAVGLHHKAEFWVIAVLYGANLGSAQAFARSIFGSMIPPGREAQWYSLYEITDKGSSWLGPLVASLLIQATGSIRYSLIYLICVMIAPALLLFYVDVPRGRLEAGRPGAGAGAPAGRSETELSSAPLSPAAGV